MKPSKLQIKKKHRLSYVSMCFIKCNSCCPSNRQKAKLDDIVELLKKMTFSPWLLHANTNKQSKRFDVKSKSTSDRKFDDMCWYERSSFIEEGDLERVFAFGVKASQKRIK